jgi:hypothetical protein
VGSLSDASPSGKKENRCNSHGYVACSSASIIKSPLRGPLRLLEKRIRDLLIAEL